MQAENQKMFDLLSERTKLLELGINSDSALIRGLAAYIRLQPDLEQGVCGLCITTTRQSQCDHQLRGRTQYGHPVGLPVGRQ